jgi:RNA polymerase sigma-70 factor (ECF subfamily)
MTPAAAHVASFEAVRPRLFGIAYRTLESAADADDVVQDAWIRWHRTDRNKVRDTAAFLATTTKRLALNVAQSARVRHETSVDPRHPEPVDLHADPTLGAERREALALALRTLMERLSPSERAAYLLREAFDYPYRRIAGVLATSEANARQLVTRARLHLASEPRGQVGPAEQQRFIDAFVNAAQTGDLTTLEQLLAADVATTSPVAIAA